MGGALAWAVPTIKFAAALRRSRPPRGRVTECVGPDPYCGLGVCDFSNCVPSSCWCEPEGAGPGPGVWVCKNDCLGHCI